MKREDTMVPSAPMSVMLVEDSLPVRERLRALVADRPCLRLVAEASTVAEAKHHLKTARPEAVVLDLGLPDGSGLHVLGDVRRCCVECVVIVLSEDVDFETCKCCRELGAKFVFRKSNEFEQAIETLCALSGRTNVQVGAGCSGCEGSDEGPFVDWRGRTRDDCGCPEGWRIQ